MDRRKQNHIPINHTPRKTLDSPPFENRSIPEHPERTTLQELKTGLHNGDNEEKCHEAVHADPPGTSTLEAEKKYGDGELDERDGPVPYYLRNE